MKKVFLIIMVVVMLVGGVYAETYVWPELIANKTYKAILEAPDGYIYHIGSDSPINYENNYLKSDSVIIGVQGYGTVLAINANTYYMNINENRVNVVASTHNIINLSDGTVFFSPPPQPIPPLAQYADNIPVCVTQNLNRILPVGILVLCSMVSLSLLDKVFSHFSGGL